MARTYVDHYKATFEMSNGSEFMIRWSERVTPATFYDPEEVGASEPTWYIDGEEVDDLPKGLDKILERLVTEGVRDDSADDDYYDEPDDPYYD